MQDEINKALSHLSTALGPSLRPLEGQCSKYSTMLYCIHLHQQNTLVLVAAWGLLNQLGSNTSRSKRIFKNRTSFNTCYLGSTWTSKIFLFKLGPLTCYLLFVPFLTWFHCWGGAIVLKGNIREFKSWEKRAGQVIQYFSMPLTFLQECEDSTGIRWNGTGIHRNPQEWDWIPQE